MNGVNIATVVCVPSNTFTYTVLTAENSYSFAISSVSNIGEGSVSYSSTFFAIDTPAAPVLLVSTSTRDSCSLLMEPSSSSYKFSDHWICYFDWWWSLECSQWDMMEALISDLSTTIFNLQARWNYILKGYALNKAVQRAMSAQVTCYEWCWQ